MGPLSDGTITCSACSQNGSIVVLTRYDANHVRVSLGPLHGGIELGQQEVLLLLTAAGAVGLPIPEQALQHTQCRRDTAQPSDNASGLVSW